MGYGIGPSGVVYLVLKHGIVDETLPGGSGTCLVPGCSSRSAQSFQESLIKEYSSNHIVILMMA